MNQNSLRRVACFIACFGSGPAVRAQVSSGGVVAAPSAVVDFTNAGQTIPARKLAADPATCTLGEQYFNTTSNVLKVCTAANTWTAPGAGSVSSVGLTSSNNVFTISGSPVTSSGTLTITPSGTSGGIPYFSGANAMASSAALAVNSIMVGGGAGVAPKTTSVTIDASGDITTPGTITSGSGASSHGKLALGELPSNGSTTVGWEAQDLMANSLSLVFPNAAPAANSLMLFPAPTSGQSQWSWTTIPGCLDSSGNHLNFNSATGAISCGTTSSGSAQATMSVANATTIGTTINTLTKLTGTPSTAVVSSAGDTGGAVGITTAGAGATGSATISYMGVVACVFDGATVAGDYVQISSTSAGDCHDTGSLSYPSSGQVIGRVLSTNAAGGTYNLDLFPAEMRPPTLSAATGVTVTPSGGAVAIGADTTVMATQKQMQQGAPICANDTGTADAYAVALTPVPTSLTRYLTVCFKASAANATTTPAINVNGLGAKTIVSEGGAAVTAGVIQASGYYWLQYDDSSAKFFMVSNPSKVPGAGVVLAPNAQSGAGYTVASSDWGKLLTLSNASAQVLTLPQAGSGFPNGWYVDVENTGTGTWTITPATSTIDGATTLALTTNQGVRVFSNGTNYFTQRGIGGGGATYVAGSGVLMAGSTISADPSVVALRSGLQSGVNTYALDTSGNATHSAGLTPALTAYTDGMCVNFKAGSTQAGVQTLTLNGVGAKNFYDVTGGANPSLITGHDYTVCYDSTLNSGAGGFKLSDPGHDFSEVNKIPAASCNNATAEAEMNLPTSNGPTPTCRTGANVQTGYLAFSASQSAQFQLELPADWDTGTNPYLRINYTQTGTTGSQTIAYQVQIGCSATSDDPVFAAAQAFATTTTGTTANAPYNQTLQLNATSMSGCTGGNVMNVKLSTTSSSNGASGLQFATITIPRLDLIQAN